jgi:hypothetical protein
MQTLSKQVQTLLFLLSTPLTKRVLPLSQTPAEAKVPLFTQQMSFNATFLLLGLYVLTLSTARHVLKNSFS